MMIAPFAVAILMVAGESHPWLPPFGIDRVGKGDAPFQADIRCDVTPRINPVDLNCILPPHDWLLIGPEQKVAASCAAFSLNTDYPLARVEANYVAHREAVGRTNLPLLKGQRSDVLLNLPKLPESGERDKLQITVLDGEKILWSKSIDVMFARKRPAWPRFGAIATKLRYDAPISVRNQDGSFSTMKYDTAWAASLEDIVVCLPDGGRFVFWRGSSYIPFWAGEFNTGLSYEWAETSPPKDGFADCVEPLMDKTLRYGRVQILESTAARVRVRWTYQSCDFLYKVWGDTAEEIFTFYPDGYGTRTLTIQSAPDGDYELSEFIILTPQAAYPLEVLPQCIVSLLFRDGSRHDMVSPVREQLPATFPSLKADSFPVVYRIKLHKDDPRTGIYFNANDGAIPPVAFAGFVDQGKTVTPCYWGSHWPLARGQTTGGAINDRIHASPGHNSVLSWARHRPAAIADSSLMTIDSLGRSKWMRRQTWTWLIGLTAATDAKVRDVAHSFAVPPNVTAISGAALETDGYAPDRRAIQLRGDENVSEITLEPNRVFVNPVLEFRGRNQRPLTVSLNGTALEPSQFAWGNGTLWIEATLTEKARVRVEFPPE